MIRKAAALLLTLLAAAPALNAAAQEVVSSETVAAGASEGGGGALAQVETTLVAEVREESMGSSGNPVRYFVPARLLEQGREVFYTVRIKNPGAQFAADVAVVQRIPQNTDYVPNSATGPGAEISVSADGGVTFGPEGGLTYTDPTGIARPATAQDYTHIRWRLRNPLAPGAIALARFRAVFR